MDDARTFLKECANDKHLTLIVPDKDGEYYFTTTGMVAFDGAWYQPMAFRPEE